MSRKPHAEACEQNRQPIFEVLQPRVADASTLLEIGSGTGQHAAYFAPMLPHLIWQTSDLPELHDGINLWLDETGAANLRRPIELDVMNPEQWSSETYDAVYSANTAHIMPMEAVEAMFMGVGRILSEHGPFLLYGPFMYDGQHTSESNHRFDRSIRAHVSHRGIRDVTWLREIADKAGLVLAEDVEMPVNNRTLVWRKAG